uniref:Tudor domain-containing protein n=1 Tax=Strongyloides stercoralis TaxID=6248 RepID=A0A0K0EAQ6_STRER
MWNEFEKQFWQGVVNEEKYDETYFNSIFSFVTSELLDLSLDSISEMPLRDNTRIYSEIIDNDNNTGSNLIDIDSYFNNYQVGDKVLALYEEDNNYYVATITSINYLERTVNVIYDGFEDEGEYVVSASDIDNYNEEEEELFSDEIFDNGTRNSIVTDKIDFPFVNGSKVFAEYYVDRMYYLGTVAGFDEKNSTYKVIFSGFQDEGVFEIKEDKVLKCSDDCYYIANDKTFITPFKFPEICEDKEELIDSYLLSKHHSDILNRLLQDVIVNDTTDGWKQNIPDFIKKYFDNDEFITLDMMILIYVFTEFLTMCFQKSYHNIKV